MNSTDFIVIRNDLQQCKVIETQLPDAAALPADALLVKVTRFAFTANNITYAVIGEQLKYWHLFPAPEGYGIIPVWGFGEVLISKHPMIAVGETLFGYLPMAAHLVIEAADVNKRGLRDGAAHRQEVSPVYNAYARVSGDPTYAGQQGDFRALLLPLFMLSFLVGRRPRRECVLRRTPRHPVVGLEQDRVRPRPSRAQAGYPRDRADLQGQCRFRQLARLL
ncbi:hypothetical protein ACVWZM_005124 [Bradyrhizobium sp. USDA 4501]